MPTNPIRYLIHRLLKATVGDRGVNAFNKVAEFITGYPVEEDSGETEPLSDTGEADERR